mgnify:CR=1 FL=1
MAYTFLKALGEQVGKSLVEEDKLELGEASFAGSQNPQAETPASRCDHVAADKVDANAHVTQGRSRATDSRQPDGVWTLVRKPSRCSKKISRARTILWNGPMGVFEMSPFAKGTFKVAQRGRG